MPNAPAISINSNALDEDIGDDDEQADKVLETSYLVGEPLRPNRVGRMAANVDFCRALSSDPEDTTQGRVGGRQRNQRPAEPFSKDFRARAPESVEKIMSIIIREHKHCTWMS